MRYSCGLFFSLYVDDAQHNRCIKFLLRFCLHFFYILTCSAMERQSEQCPTMVRWPTICFLLMTEDFKITATSSTISKERTTERSEEMNDR